MRPSAVPWSDLNLHSGSRLLGRTSFFGGLVGATMSSWGRVVVLNLVALSEIRLRRPDLGTAGTLPIKNSMLGLHRSWEDLCCSSLRLSQEERAGQEDARGREGQSEQGPFHEGTGEEKTLPQSNAKRAAEHMPAGAATKSPSQEREYEQMKGASWSFCRVSTCTLAARHSFCTAFMRSNRSLSCEATSS